MGHDRIAPVEESRAGRPDEHVAAVEVVVLDRGRDPRPVQLPGPGRDPRAHPRSRSRAASLPARSSGPTSSTTRPRRRGGPASAPGWGADRRDAESDQLVGVPLDRALQLGVHPEDPLPGDEVGIARAVRSSLAERGPAVLEEKPATFLFDGQRRDHRPDPPACQRWQQSRLVRVRCARRLGPDRTAVRRKVEDRRPRSDVWLLGLAEHVVTALRKRGTGPSVNLASHAGSVHGDRPVSVTGR